MIAFAVVIVIALLLVLTDEPWKVLPPRDWDPNAYRAWIAKGRDV